MFLYFLFCISALVNRSEQTSGEALCDQLLKMSEYCAAEQGIPHVVGEAGPPGPPGPPGKAAFVNYSRIERTIEQELEECKTKISALEEMVTWYQAPNGYRYKVFEDRSSYQVARQKCEAKGARLVTTGMRDSFTRSHLKQLMKMKNADVWIGANDIEKEGNFVWEDGIALIDDDIEWSGGQPDDYKNEDCVHYRPSYGWLANDAPCGASNMYMCEKVM